MQYHHAIDTMAGPGQPSPSSGSSRWYRPVNGFHPHPPALRHRLGAKLLGGTMVFWILYRAKQDGAVLLVSARDLGLPRCLIGKRQDAALMVGFCLRAGVEAPMGWTPWPRRSWARTRRGPSLKRSRRRKLYSCRIVLPAITHFQTDEAG